MSARMPTYWLSMHVPYACRHAGACCSSGWPIPIEHSRVAAVTTLRAGDDWLQAVADPPRDAAGQIAVSPNGHCIFHRHGCEIQHAFGHAALPSACQHFPRQVLLDRRGVFVTLSHYCPTAADLLFTHQGAVHIVEGPPAVRDGQPEGLDAREVLPPLLTDGATPRSPGPGRTFRRQVMPRPVLMDLEGYSAWEAHMVHVLSTSSGEPEDALNRLESDLRIVQRWRPGEVSLTETVVSLHASANHERSSDDDSNAVIGRYLAATAFASWAAYQPDGVIAVLNRLRLALSTLRQLQQRLPLKEAIRQTDFAIIHSIDGNSHACHVR